MADGDAISMLSASASASESYPGDVLPLSMDPLGSSMDSALYATCEVGRGVTSPSLSATGYLNAFIRPADEGLPGA